MKRKYRGTRSSHGAVSPLHHPVQPPPPPKVCSGFIYTVQRGDSMFLIAQRFGIPLQDLIRANPQIQNPSLIFIGQRICVPAKRPHPPHPHPPHPHPPHPHPPHPHPPHPHPPHPHPPEAVEVEFLGRDRKPIREVQGVFRLPRHTIVRARFPMHINEAFLFFTPASQPFEQTRLIEAKRVDRTNVVEFHWQVPANIRGTVFVIGCSGTICRRSRDYRVVSES